MTAVLCLWWGFWAAVVVALVWQMRRAVHEPLEADQAIADARTARPSSPAPDTEWGSDLALRDACELAHSVPWPEADDAGWDRLLTAIHDHREDDAP